MAGPASPTLRYEESAWAGGQLLIGVDEVGRGPLAGPVVAAAVVFPLGAVRLEGVRDSKTLSAAQRAALLPALYALALAVAVGAASVAEIDRVNIRGATARAMRRAIRRLLAQRPSPPPLGSPLSAPSAFSSPPPLILLDGLRFPEVGYPHEALVDGDTLCYSIAAAGIVAKEVRDRLMRRLAPRYPGYGWETNAGYGTSQHCDAIQELGPTPHHRQHFAPVAQYPLPF